MQEVIKDVNESTKRKKYNKLKLSNWVRLHDPRVLTSAYLDWYHHFRDTATDLRSAHAAVEHDVVPFVQPSGSSSSVDPEIWKRLNELPTQDCKKLYISGKTQEMMRERLSVMMKSSLTTVNSILSLDTWLKVMTHVQDSLGNLYKEIPRSKKIKIVFVSDVICAKPS